MGLIKAGMGALGGTAACSIPGACTKQMEMLLRRYCNRKILPRVRRYLRQ